MLKQQTVESCDSWSDIYLFSYPLGFLIWYILACIVHCNICVLHIICVFFRYDIYIYAPVIIYLYCMCWWIRKILCVHTNDFHLPRPHQVQHHQPNDPLAEFGASVTSGSFKNKSPRMDVDHLNQHPGRLTWNIIMEVWKIMFLSKWMICRFHVNLPEWNHRELPCFFFFKWFFSFWIMVWNQTSNFLEKFSCVCLFSGETVQRRWIL